MTEQNSIHVNDLEMYLYDNLNRSWGDMIVDDEMKYLVMWEGEWRQIANDHIKTSGHPEAATAWVKMIDRDREPHIHDKGPFPMLHHKPEPVNFSLWKDMVDEPCKYGDEITEVLELEDRLMRAARTRQRVLDYWHQKDVEKFTPSVRIIQQKWREYKYNKMV